MRSLRLSLFVAAVLQLNVATLEGRSGTNLIPSGSTHVLFIGNSLTYTNDLPGTVSALAASVGDTIRTRTVALPDLALIDHVHGASDAMTVLRAERWDYVVLQQGPSSLPVNRDTLVLATVLLNPFIKATGATSAQFMVWPASNRPQDFPRVLESSQAAAREVGGVMFAAGQAWANALAKDPSLPLYGADGYHPAPLGTYLAALVIYEGITGHDARRLQAKAIVSGSELPVSPITVRMMQQIAHETAAQYRAH
ncbi:MAG: hypothetical protein JWM95_4368 [Gemmatimonadetes bacterium]|nr:hypothetical protein [Gemmatimonadota bacterium]